MRRASWLMARGKFCLSLLARPPPQWIGCLFFFSPRPLWWFWSFLPLLRGGCGWAWSAVYRFARAATRKAEIQSGYGLWSKDTPFGDDGYFQDLSYDNPSGPDVGTSFHIFTVDGILGRDKTK